MKKEIAVTCDIDVDVIAAEAALKAKTYAQKQVKEEINGIISNAIKRVEVRNEVEKQFKKHLEDQARRAVWEYRNKHLYGCAETLKKESLEEIYFALMSTALFEKLLADDEVKNVVARIAASRVADRICERLGSKRIYSKFNEYIKRAIVEEGAET